MGIDESKMFVCNLSCTNNVGIVEIAFICRIKLMRFDLGRVMGKLVTGKMLSTLVLGASVLALTGCIGGTTYGTGVTQEAQLLKDLEGMITFGTRKSKVRIDHTARPDLVMPSKTAALPIPHDQESSSSNANWPESPEQKIARIRSEVEQPDPRSGAISVQELKRKKIGTRYKKPNNNAVDVDRDGHGAITAFRDGTHEKVKSLKEKYAYSDGPSRKYLTEPPVEYRVPISTAPVGDLGVSEAEKEKRAEKAAKLKRQNDTGMWTD